MKTSNQLLLTLFVVLLLVIIGSAMVLKTEYEKIDRKDPFYGYTKEASQPFHTVQLQGNHPELIQLQPGDNFEIRVGNSIQDLVSWKVQGDTLTLSYFYPEERNRHPESFAFFGKPVVYILAPQLSVVKAEGITCQLSGWKAKDLTLQQTGAQRGMLLTENALENVSATLAQGSLIQIEASNQIQKLQAQVNDSSTLMAKYGVIDSLQLRADSTAQVSLPGSMLHTLRIE